MSSKKTYVVPDRMHYDIYEKSPSGMLFMCSTNKEGRALEIADGLRLRAVGNVEYKIRARATVEHTIHSLRVEYV